MKYYPTSPGNHKVKLLLRGKDVFSKTVPAFDIVVDVCKKGILTIPSF